MGSVHKENKALVLHVRACSRFFKLFKKSMTNINASCLNKNLRLLTLVTPDGYY